MNSDYAPPDRRRAFAHIRQLSDLEINSIVYRAHMDALRAEYEVQRYLSRARLAY